MNKYSVVILMVFALISALLIYSDNQEYSVQVHDLDVNGNPVFFDEFEKQSLADGASDTSNLILLFLVFLSCPILLMIESTFFPGLRNRWGHLIFLAQACLHAYFLLMVWLSMVFKFWSDIHLFTVHYLILAYLGSFVIWNLLLALPLRNKFNFIEKSFDIMSLVKHQKG